jgi:HEAT repeat protein
MENKIDELIAEFTCDDVIKCQKARRSLVAMGDKAVQPLIKELTSKKHWVRWEAAKALGQIGDAAAAKALVAALEDKEFDVHWLAAEALITMGWGALEPLLEALVDRGDKSLFLRQGAHHVLHDIKLGKLEGILKPVMVALDSSAPSIEVLQAARKALNALKNR